MKPTAIVIPCYNEERRLDGSAFSRVMTELPDLHLIFVDDGSKDRTPELLREMAEEMGGRAVVLQLPRNRRKAEAVRAGVNHALRGAMEGEFGVVGYWDADLSTDLREVPRLQDELASRPAALAAIGSRVRLAGRRIERRAVRHYSGRVFATFAALTLGLAVYDTQCGAKLFRVSPAVLKAFERPFKANWAFDVELLARLLASGPLREEEVDLIVEVPLQAWTDVPGSKVRFWDIPRMLLELTRIYMEYRIRK